MGLPAEDVPIAMNILGVGGTGKSTLLEKYFGALVGYKYTPTFTEFGRVDKKFTRSQAVAMMGGYFNSEISRPLMIDEVPVNLYSSIHGEDMVKSWSNDRNGVHPVIVTTSNTNAGILKPQLLSRILVIPIDSSYKLGEEQVYSFNELREKISLDIYINMLQRIESRINNLSSEDIKMIADDYLYIAKDEFNKYLEDYGLDNSISDFSENYNIINIRGKSTWSGLLISNADNLSINPANPEELVLYSRAFPNETKKMAAKSLLAGGVLKASQGDDMILNIRALEEFVGYEIEEILKNQSSYKQGVTMANSLKEALVPVLTNQPISQPKKSFLDKIFKK